MQFNNGLVLNMIFQVQNCEFKTTLFRIFLGLEAYQFIYTLTIYYGNSISKWFSKSLGSYGSNRHHSPGKRNPKKFLPRSTRQSTSLCVCLCEFSPEPELVSKKAAGIPTWKHHRAGQMKQRDSKCAKVCQLGTASSYRELHPLPRL